MMSGFSQLYYLNRNPIYVKFLLVDGGEVVFEFFVLAET